MKEALVAMSSIPRYGRRRLPLYGDVGGPTRGFGAFEMLPAFTESTPLVSRSIFGREVLLAGRYDVVADLADDARFVKYVGPALQHLRPLAGDGLFTAYNEEPNWARAHDILMPAFALDEIESYHPTMLGVADELLAAWDGQAAAGRPVDVAADMTSLTPGHDRAGRVRVRLRELPPRQPAPVHRRDGGLAAARTGEAAPPAGRRPPLSQGRRRGGAPHRDDERRHRRGAARPAGEWRHPHRRPARPDAEQRAPGDR
jgi:hypothetical protein